MTRRENPELLRAVLQAPDDDEPRLVYADWMQEHGDTPRGELITVQCELAQRLTPSWTGYDHFWVQFLDPHVRGLALRERELLRAHEQRWSEPLKGIIYKGWYRRGFIERASINMKELDTLLARAQELAPIRHVRLLVYRPDLTREVARDLVTSDTLRRVDAIELVNLIGQAQLPALLEAPSTLHDLRHFNLDGNDVNDETIAFLARQPWTRLESLSVARCDVEGSTLDQLFSRVPTLRSIKLNSNPLSDTAARAIADAPSLRGMQELFLSFCRLSDAGVELLCKAEHLASLRVVYLTDTQLGAASAVAIADSTWSALRVLSLDRCPIGNEGVRALAGSATLDLRWLSLSGCNITDEGARAICDSTTLGSLQYLNLKQNTLSRPVRKQLSEHYGPGVCLFSRD